MSSPANNSEIILNAAAANKEAEEVNKSKNDAALNEEELNENDQEAAGDGEQQKLRPAERRRLRKQQRKLDQKQFKKQKHKENVKLRADNKEERQKKLSLLPPEEQARIRQEGHERFQKIVNERNEKKQMRNDKLDAMYNSVFSGSGASLPMNAVGIIIDCGFDHLMSEAENASLAQQLLFTYSSNGVNGEDPHYVAYTSVNGRLKTKLTGIHGYENWKVYQSEESWDKVFAKEKSEDRIVYLSPDATEVLPEMQPGTFYVIGGLIDKNRNKNVTINKSKSLNVRAYKLPIHQTLEMKTCPVLTVNQVFDILKEWNKTKDWKISLEKAIPERKRLQNIDPNVSKKNRRKKKGLEKEAEKAAAKQAEEANGKSLVAQEEPQASNESLVSIEQNKS